MSKGLLPHKDQSGTYEPITSTLEVSTDSAKGSLHLQAAADAYGPYYVGTEHSREGKVLGKAFHEFPQQTAFDISKDGGEAIGFSGNVKVTFPDKILAEDIELYVGPTREDFDPRYTPSSSPFEITGVGELSEAEISQFSGETRIVTRSGLPLYWAHSFLGHRPEHYFTSSQIS